MIERVSCRLMAAGCVAADEEARGLVSAAADDDALEAWIRRREDGEPLAWILGTTAFCGHAVRVDRGVYVPRHHTEELARRAAALLPEGGSAVDVCTGAGAIAVHLMAEVLQSRVVGVELDRRAATCARRNGVSVVVGDIDAPLRSHAFDVVTAVAPYVPTGGIDLLPRDVQRHEPRVALDGGDDGLDLVRRVVRSATRLLRLGGWLLTELGGDQDERLRPTLVQLGFEQLNTWCDEEGDLRGIAARLASRPG